MSRCVNFLRAVHGKDQKTTTTIIQIVKCEGEGYLRRRVEKEKEREGEREWGEMKRGMSSLLVMAGSNSRLKSRKCKQCPGNSNDGPDSLTNRRTLELQVWFVE